MKWLLTLLLAASACVHAQDTNEWKEISWLIGDWVAEPAAGQSGEFSLHPDLNGAVLVRHSRADYEARPDKPAEHHRDLMVVYREGSALRADYFDNEHHVIRYAVSADAAEITFISDMVAGAPRFRLVYTKLPANQVNIRFEIAPPNQPGAFKTYVESKAHRK